MEIMNPASFPTNYVVPADILPDGIAIAPSPGVYKAGTVAHADLSYSAGTLLRAGTRLTQDVAVGAMLHLDSSLFQKGFANYDVIGGYGVAVAEGANLALNMPVMQLDLPAARQLANGGI